MRHLNLAAALFLAVAVVVPVTVRAEMESTATPEDVEFVIGSTIITASAGSSLMTAEVIDGSLVMELGVGDLVVLRTAGPNPVRLENDASLAACNVTQLLENQMTIVGPRTVSVTPGTTACSEEGAGENAAPSLSLDEPAAGELVRSGDTRVIAWSSAGRAVSSVTLALSLDGGVTYPQVLGTNLVNSGSFSWTVASLAAAEAQLRLTAFEAGTPVALAVSPIFIISGPKAGPCTPGLRIKSPINTAVYLCGADGKRHAFPNSSVYASWYADFVGVVTVTPAELASVALGRSVTYRPDVSLVKLMTDPKVYAVSEGGVLHWIETAEAAVRLYGTGWKKLVHDVPDTFFPDYTVGESLK